MQSLEKNPFDFSPAGKYTSNPYSDLQQTDPDLDALAALTPISRLPASCVPIEKQVQVSRAPVGSQQVQINTVSRKRQRHASAESKLKIAQIANARNLQVQTEMQALNTSPHFLQAAAGPSSLLTAPAPKNMIPFEQWITENQKTNTARLAKKHRQQMSKVHGELSFLREKGNYTELDFEALAREVDRLLLRTKAPAR